MKINLMEPPHQFGDLFLIKPAAHRQVVINTWRNCRWLINSMEHLISNEITADDFGTSPRPNERCLTNCDDGYHVARLFIHFLFQTSISKGNDTCKLAKWLEPVGDYYRPVTSNLYVSHTITLTAELSWFKLNGDGNLPSQLLQQKRGSLNGWITNMWIRI